MRFTFALFLIGFLLTLSLNLFAQTSGSGTVSIQNAIAEDKYLYLFFYKEQNDKTAKLQAVFDQTMQKLGEKVKSAKVNVKSASEQSVVDQFNLKRAPMPFVLVLAPSGAITGGFSTFNEEQLLNSQISMGAAHALKALQDHKLLILTLQNSRTTSNQEALSGINEFKADPRYSEATVIITLDPSDPQEQKFLNQLNLDTHLAQATTVLIAPPAEIIGKYQGPTHKAQMVADVQKAASGCCPDGCCPGGCCPGGKCGK